MSEDAFVDRLIENAPACGAPLILARAPRAYVDLNRNCTELDPALIAEIGTLGKGRLTPKVAAGLGVIPRVVGDRRAIYPGKLPLHEARDRLNRVWYPYHAALRQLMDSTHATFGHAILIDMHSMPHRAVQMATPKNLPVPQIVLGDRFGMTCSGWIVDRIEAIFRADGFRVARNVPFAGAHIIGVHGQPARNRHAIQIEIDRALYIEERHIRRTAAFDAFAARMQRIVARLAGIDPGAARFCPP